MLLKLYNIKPMSRERERISSEKFDIPIPLRKDRIETYLYDETKADALDVARQLRNPKKPLAPTVVAIPVAAHQESPETVINTIEQYAGQKDAGEFTVSLLLNYPANEHGSSNVSAIEKTVARLKKQHKDTLDLRYAKKLFLEPTIGAIRKSLWDGIAHVALMDGLYDQPENDVVMINNDIDAEFISPVYVRNVQRFYDRAQGRRNSVGIPSDLLPLGATQVRHAMRWDTHPRTSGAVFWNDLAHRQVMDAQLNGGYEAGLVVPLSLYARNGGFDASATKHESRPMHGRGDSVAIQRRIQSTAIVTSPRRYLERFPSVGYDVWGGETFTHTDGCRTTDELSFPDATQEEVDKHVGRDIERFGQWFVDAGQLIAERKYGHSEGLSGPISVEKVVTEARETHRLVTSRIRLAHKVMTQIVQSPTNVPHLPRLTLATEILQDELLGLQAVYENPAVFDVRPIDSKE